MTRNIPGSVGWFTKDIERGDDNEQDFYINGCACMPFLVRQD